MCWSTELPYLTPPTILPDNIGIATADPAALLSDDVSPAMPCDLDLVGGAAAADNSSSNSTNNSSVHDEDDNDDADDGDDEIEYVARDDTTAEQEQQQQQQQQHPPDYSTYENPLPAFYPCPSQLQTSPHPPHPCFMSNPCAATNPAPQCYSYGGYALTYNPSDMQYLNQHQYHNRSPAAALRRPIFRDYHHVRPYEQPHSFGHAIPGYHHAAAPNDRPHYFGPPHPHYYTNYHDDSYCHHSLSSSFPTDDSNISEDGDEEGEEEYDDDEETSNDDKSNKSLKLSLKHAFKKVKNTLAITAIKVFIGFRRDRYYYDDDRYDDPYYCSECDYMGHYNGEYGGASDCACYDEYGRACYFQHPPHPHAYRGGQPYHHLRPCYDPCNANMHINEQCIQDTNNQSSEDSALCSFHQNHHDSSINPTEGEVVEEDDDEEDLTEEGMQNEDTSTMIGTTTIITRNGKEICQCKPCLKLLAIKIIKNSRSGRRKYRRIITTRYRNIAVSRISRLNAL